MRLSYTFLILGSVALGLLRTLFALFMSGNDGWLTPTIYKSGDLVEVIVNKVESDVTQLPYAYYDLPFTCPPSTHKKPLHLSLNEIIKGDRKWQSDYKLVFNEDDDCHVLCARKTTRDGMQTLKDLIQKGYVVQWLIDNDLPAATTFISTIDQKKYYASGFPLGFVDEDTGKVYLNNHLMLVIRFHALDDYNFTIVGFEVYPKSVSNYDCPGASKNYEQYEVLIPQDPKELTYIPFTYSVYWREEFDIDWNHRYDLFFNNGELSNSVSIKFHWINLSNSIGITFLMTFIVSLIIFKINKNDKETIDGSFNESVSLINNSFSNNEIQMGKKNSIFVIARSWYHNDKSPLPHIFIFLVSMGVQFLFTIIGSLTISCSLNKLHNIRHTVLSMALLFFILGAFMASYIGTSLAIENNKLATRRGSLKNIIVNSTIFPIVCGSLLPGLVMIITICLNSIIWAHDSTNALPFSTLVKLISLYFIVCLPLSYLGGIFAHGNSHREYTRLRSDSIRKTPFDIKPPLDRTSIHLNSSTNILKNIKRKLMLNIKRLVLDSFTCMVILVCGIFPFIIIYVELQYVYKSVWLEKTSFYYFYGFLLANIILLCLVISELAIISSYLMMTMSTRDYAETWRWRSFQLSSSCAWYMEFYSLYYVFKVLNIRGFSSIFISICYSLLFNTLCGLAMGSLGYLVTLAFVKHVFRIRYKH